MVAGTAAGAILLVVFASKLPREIVVVEGCLDVVWLASFLWVALTLDRRDVAALYAPQVAHPERTDTQA